MSHPDLERTLSPQIILPLSQRWHLALVVDGVQPEMWKVWDILDLEVTSLVTPSVLPQLPLFFHVLGIELRSPHMLDKSSTPWVMPPALLFVFCFSDRASLTFPNWAWTYAPPCLHLTNSWAYSCIQLCPGRHPLSVVIGSWSQYSPGNCNLGGVFWDIQGSWEVTSRLWCG
jgi:hypothetical protein